MVAHPFPSPFPLTPWHRYFSYQSYDANYDPIKSMRDYEIRPVKGLNPFADNLANRRKDVGSYQVPS
jgi:hypothetical protein